MNAYFFLIAGTALIFLSVLIRLAEGIEYMADVEAQALATLSTVADEVVALLAKMAASSPVDHSADIAAVTKKLTDAIAASAPPAAPAPAAPSA